MSGKDGGWMLPENIDAPTRCYQIEIPDDPLYIAAFMGALWELQYWWNWQRDPDHKAIQVAKRLRPLLENIRYCDGTPVNTGFAGAGGDDEIMLRQNPENPCELQNSVDGVTWCTWADLSLCVQTDQPGDNSRQPSPGGGEQCYTAKLMANGQWLLPTSVNTGDTLMLTKPGGAATGGTINWYCPNGNAFVAGVCIPGTGGYASGDPVALAFHMAVVVKIAAVYYVITPDVLFTVPAGVSNAQVVFQVNDSVLTDNAGDYSFEVCVKNNQASNWSHTFAFPATAANFGAQSYTPGSPPGSVYTLGTGWVSNKTDAGDGTGINRYMQDDIVFDWGTSTILTSVVAKMNTAVGTNAGGSSLAQQLQYRTGVANTNLTSITPATGTGQTISWTGTQAATGLRLHSTTSDAGNGGTATGSMLWTEITITGRGFDPWA